MQGSLKQSSQGNSRYLVILVVFCLVLALGAVGFYVMYVGVPLPLLQGRLVGPDRGSSFTPLVAHSQNNGAPCFDNGTSYCENLVSGSKRTVGFLFQQRPMNLAYESLYGCVNMRSSLQKYILTTTYTECRQQGLWPYYYGYVAKSDDFEASTPLIYCEESGEVVPIATDCNGAARHLGYMMMSASSVVVNMCEELKAAGGTHSYCTELAGGEEARPNSSAWRNNSRSADVNADGAITSQDLLMLINASNDGQTGPLPVTPASGQVPPYIDVNGDGSFSNLDFNALFGTEDWRTFMIGWEAASITPFPPTPLPVVTSAPVPPWQNPRNTKDVNNDGAVTPQDLLTMANQKNSRGFRALPAPTAGDTPPPYLDVNGDNSFTQADLDAWGI